MEWTFVSCSFNWCSKYLKSLRFGCTRKPKERNVDFSALRKALFSNAINFEQLIQELFASGELLQQRRALSLLLKRNSKDIFSILLKFNNKLKFPYGSYAFKALIDILAILYLFLCGSQVSYAARPYRLSVFSLLSFQSFTNVRFLLRNFCFLILSQCKLSKYSLSFFSFLIILFASSLIFLF